MNIENFGFFQKATKSITNVASTIGNAVDKIPTKGITNTLDNIPTGGIEKGFSSTGKFIDKTGKGAVNLGGGIIGVSAGGIFGNIGSYSYYAVIVVIVLILLYVIMKFV